MGSFRCLPNFLIGLREGLEAALIVAILIAYLVRTQNSHALGRLGTGVAAAIGISIALGFVLILVDESLSERAAEAFAGVTSLLAVGLITWMIFWMASHARHIKTHLHGEVDKALNTSTTAVALVAFLAVIREGLETVLFLYAGIKSSGETTAPLIGAILGLATAVVLGVLMYRGAVKLNLGALFKWTGAALVIVAGGVLRYAVHEFQELGWLPGENAVAIDVSSTIASDSVVGTLIRGLVNLTPTMTWLEVIIWLAYVVPTLTLFFWLIGHKGKPSPPPTTTHASENVPVEASR
jgi:high-affinity iron transporter